MQAVAKTVGKGYDRVSGAATKISNKIDDISAKSRNSISNLFNKTTSKIGSKIDDIGLKARSLNLKHAEVPSLAMAGGGNAGRPVKVPIGVGINEKKLEKLRQMKVNPSGDTRKLEKVANMKEFFNTEFGDTIKNSIEKTKHKYDGQSIYRVTEKSGHFKKGDYLYLDAMHKDHIEVFSKQGKLKSVLNLDGTINDKKFKVAKAENRRISV